MNLPPEESANISLDLLADKPAGLRRVPTQRRSKERVQRMLEVAIQCIVEKGIDAVRMSEIAELSGVSIGSLYQYFPDKTSIVMTLAEHYNKEGQACVGAALNAVNTEEELLQAMLDIVDGYYEMYLTTPVMRDIWRATQADKLLQEVDNKDCDVHKSLLLNALLRIRPQKDKAALIALASLIMLFVGTTVRFAISVEREQGDSIIALFKQMLTGSLLNQ